jgi:SNF2 family DNA or RNA helicase
MPPITTQTVTVEVDARSLKECDAYVTAHGGLDNILETLSKALDFKTMSKVASALAAAKIPAMLEHVESHEEQEEPLVVFSAHRAPIDVLTKRKGWGVITGDTSDKDRARLIEEFQAGKLRGMGCTIRAAGVAITLTRSCNLLFVDREWNPALNIQARDRVYRIGQDRPVSIVVLVANHPLDERVTELNLAKQALIDASVDGAREMQDADEERGRGGPCEESHASEAASCLDN